MLSPKRGTISCSAFSVGKMGLVGEVKLYTLTLLPLQWDVRRVKVLNSKASMFPNLDHSFETSNVLQVVAARAHPSKAWVSGIAVDSLTP